MVFLGASITEAFYYPGYDEFFPDYDFHKVIEFGPDKSSVFPDIADLKPDIVTFKECGAYFDEGGDTDMPAMQGFMQDIADFCTTIGAVPVPTTTLPIDVGYGGHTQALLEDIIEFDIWGAGVRTTAGCAWTITLGSRTPMVSHPGSTTTARASTPTRMGTVSSGLT